MQSKDGHLWTDRQTDTPISRPAISPKTEGGQILCVSVDFFFKKKHNGIIALHMNLIIDNSLKTHKWSNNTKFIGINGQTKPNSLA